MSQEGKFVAQFILNILKAYDISLTRHTSEKFFGKKENIGDFTEENIKRLFKNDPERKNPINRVISKIFEEVGEISRKENYFYVYSNQTIVLFVSSFEVYLKDLMKSLIKNEAVKNRILQSNKKINILIKDLFDNKGLEEQIVSTFNLDNLKSINESLKLVFGKNLVDIIEQYPHNKGETLGTLQKCMDMRNNILHEGIIYEISFEDITKYKDLFIRIGFFLLFEAFLVQNNQ